MRVNSYGETENTVWRNLESMKSFIPTWGLLKLLLAIQALIISSLISLLLTIDNSFILSMRSFSFY